MPRVESVDGTELFFEDIGDGRPVVLIHGWAASHEFFEPQIAALCDSFRLIGVDLRGHGKSGKPGGDYSYDTYAKDLDCVLSELEIEDAALVGWSIGGAIAIRYAAAFGDRINQLGLIGPAAPKFIEDEAFPHGLPEEEVLPLLEAEKTNRPEFRHSCFKNSVYQKLDDATHQWMWNLSMQMPRWAGVLSYEALLEEDTTDDARQIEIPTRIFQGNQDAFCPVDGAYFLADLIGDTTADVTEYEDVGHMPMWELSDQFTDDLEEFLDDH